MIESTSAYLRLQAAVERLADVLPSEHWVPIEVLRRLIGAPDTVAFHLPGPVAQRTELGQRPAMTQLSLDTATARV